MKRLIGFYKEMEEWSVLPVAFLMFAACMISPILVITKIFSVILLIFTFYVLSRYQ